MRLAFWKYGNIVFLVLFLLLLSIHIPITAQTVRSTTQHPRLYFDNAQINSLQAVALSTHQEIWTPIDAYAISQIGTTPPAAPPANSDGVFFGNEGNQLITLAFACVISADPVICDTAKNHLLTYATWTQWGANNERDLGHANMLIGNAIAYDWLFGQLTLVEQDTVRANLATRTDELYQASINITYVPAWANWWGSSYIQNHYFIMHSALGVAGLVLLNEDVRAPDWVARAIDRFSIAQALLNEIDDGSWHESIHYQNYFLTLSLPFLINVQDLQGANLFPDTYLQNYTAWRVYNYLPNTNNALFSYGDMESIWANSFAPQNILRFTANRYDDGYAEWMAQQIIAFEGRDVDAFSTPWYVFEFLYYDPTVAVTTPDNLPTERYFSDDESVVWRTGWSANDLVFGFRSGTHGGRFAFDTFLQQTFPWQAPCAVNGCSFNAGHDHDDSNTFYIYGNNQWLAPESVGVGNTATAFHNTLLIDGQGQYRPPDINTATLPTNFVNRDSYLETLQSTRNYGVLVSDATQRYDVAGLTENSRHIVFVNSEYFVMLDNLAAVTPHQYEWITHFGQNATLDGNWIRGDAGAGQVLGVAVASPAPFQATFGNDGMPFVHTSPTAPLDNARLIHVLFPTTAPQWNIRPDVSTTADTGSAAVVQLVRRDGTDCTDSIFLRYVDPVSGVISAGQFTTDSRVVVTTFCPDNTLTHLFVSGGTRVLDQGNILMEGLQPSTSLEANFVGNTAHVYTESTSQIHLLAPAVDALFVNDAPMDYIRDGQYIIFPIATGTALNERQFISKVANPPFSMSGESVVWSIQVTNPVSTPLTHVVVRDTLPDELEIEQIIPEALIGYIQGQTIEFVIDRLDPGEQILFNITTRIQENLTTPFIIENRAELTSTEYQTPFVARANIVSVSQLPVTGQSPRTIYMVVLGFLLLGQIILASLTHHRRKFI